jgi:hypothetical protein
LLSGGSQKHVLEKYDFEGEGYQESQDNDYDKEIKPDDKREVNTDLTTTRETRSMSKAKTPEKNEDVDMRDEED